MQVGAVVKLAGAGVRGNVGHTAGQLHWRDVLQAKFLKARRINQRGGALCIDPIQRGAGGGVLARIERLRNFVGQHLESKNE